MTYSIDFRKKVLSVKKKEGLSLAAISKKFAISKNTVFLWTKVITPKKHREKPPTKINTNQLKEDIAQYGSNSKYGGFNGMDLPSLQNEKQMLIF
jgi:transposase